MSYRKNVYLKRKHEFETLGEDDNNDVLSREEKMNIAKAEMDKVNPKSVKSAKDATFKNDKRLSTTSERYKGYLIVLDRGGDGYNVYDKHRELEDAGYPSKEAAKNFIDELVANDDVYSADDVDDIESEFQRIDRSGTDEEVAIAAIMYNLGTTMREAREILPTLSEDKIKDYVDYYYLRDLPTSERVKIWNKRKITSATASEYAQMVDDLDYFYEVYPEEIEPILIRNGANLDNNNWLDGCNIPQAYNEAVAYFESTYDNDDEYSELDTGVGSRLGWSNYIQSGIYEELDSDDYVDDWRELASKSVEDSDGFNTDYTLYTNGETYICMFGDKDLYEPDASYADYETENEQDAWDWFNSYTGFADEEDEYDIYGSEDLESDFNEYEDDIQEISQEFTSENTSINSTKLPAIFKMVSFEPGTTNIDYGGGRFDNVADYLTQYDVINLVYDPYNRTPEHNKEVIKTLRRAGGADTATCSNVLNVIKEPEVRKNVLENISKIVKPGGKVYITVYEGSGKGDEGPTKAGYQLNRRTADYLDEIREVFPDANRKGKLIVATNSRTVNSSTNIKASSTEGYVYTYCDECGKKNRVKVTFNNFNEPFNDTEYKCKYCGTNNLLTDPHSYDENGNVVEASQSYLDRIEELMNQGLDEETASREAYAEFYPDEYDVDDYDEIYSANYGGAYYVEVKSTQRGTAPYEKKFSDFNSALSFAKKRGNSKTIIYVWDIPKERRSSNSVPNAVYDFDSGWQIIRPVNVNEDRSVNKTITSANYGGAYDVDPEQYFTREDLVEFADDVISHIANSQDILFDVSELYIEGNNITLGLTNTNNGGGFEHTVTFTVDMRKIHKPWDLQTKYSQKIANMFIDEYNRCTADDEIYSSTTSSRKFWYFTRHGVQPGSVPKYVNILDIVDTPEGTYFLADGVILTNDLRNYEIQERRPEDEIYSSKQSNSKLNQIKDKITKVVKKVMMSAEFGFPEDEVEEYSVVEVDPSGKVEVRAEVGYDGLMTLCDALNPIVQRYDKDSYFEPVQPGIIQAWVENKNDVVESSKSPNSVANKYPEYMKVSRGGQDFSVHYNLIDNSPSADAHQMWLEFQASVSAIKPYDDAEYAWAQIENGHINVIKGGKVIQQYYYFDADDMDVENSEWCDAIIEQAIDYISKINDKVESRMVHNSTSTKGETIEAGYYDVPERPLDPPEYDDPVEEDPIQEICEFSFDAVVILDKDGGWDYENNDYSFAANPDDKHGDWYTYEDHIYLTDQTGMVEDLDDLIEPMMPAGPGKYRIQGDATMVFDVDNLYAYYDYYRDGSYDRELLKDDAEVTFNYQESKVENFKFTELN